MIGQLEPRLLDVWIQACQLRRWIARPDAPPAIKECKVLFDKVNPMDTLSEVNHFEDEPTKHAIIPAALRSIIPDQHITLYARYKHNGVIYSRSSTHIGNSLIYYHQSGWIGEAVPGSIQHIVQKDKKIVFAVKRHLPKHPDLVDPFSFYPDFPARLYSSNLSEILELVDFESVVSHCARWQIFADHVVILSLSKVCTSPHFRSILC
jgi:hypothetical protein